MKKLLAIAVAAALTAPAAVMAETTLYGKLSASVGAVKVNGAESETVVEGGGRHASRFGIKGSTGLDNGLSATYGIEYGLDLDSDAAAGVDANSQLTARNTFVGLKGGFGEVRVGRHDTPHKLSTAGLDNFADTYADSGAIGILTERRVDNAVAYINKFGPVGVAVAHTTNPGADDADARVHANSLMVNYSNGPWYAGLGHENVTGVDKDTKLGLGYSAEAGHKANIVFAQDDAANNLADSKSVLVGGQYKMGQLALKAQYGTKDFDDDTVNDRKAASLGADYSLGKKTSVYLLGHKEDVDNTNVGDFQATVVGMQTEF